DRRRAGVAVLGGGGRQGGDEVDARVDRDDVVARAGDRGRAVEVWAEQGVGVLAADDPLGDDVDRVRELALALARVALAHPPAQQEAPLQRLDVGGRLVRGDGDVD